MTEWLRIATSRPTVLRALKAASVVGLLQIAINHGDNLLRGEIDTVRTIKMAMTACVPYMVSTYSSVSALMHLRHKVSPAPREP